MKKYSTEEVGRVFAEIAEHINWSLNSKATAAKVEGIDDLIEGATFRLNQQADENVPKSDRPLMVEILESIYVEFGNAFFSIRIEGDGLHLQGRYSSDLIKHLMGNGVELKPDVNGFLCGETQMDGQRVEFIIC